MNAEFQTFSFLKKYPLTIVGKKGQNNSTAVK